MTPSLVPVSTVLADWSIDYFKKHYGDMEVFVSNNMKHEELYGTDAGDGHGERQSLAKYIDEHLSQMGDEDAADAADAEPPYCFVTPGETNDDKIQTLLETVEKPAYFLNETRFIGPTQMIFALGPTNTGSSFHDHGDAWFALVHGHKRFFLYPNCK
jgi:hypothetical protein